MNDDRPWESQTRAELLNYAAAVEIEVPASARTKREVYAAIQRGLARRITEAAPMPPCDDDLDAIAALAPEADHLDPPRPEHEGDEDVDEAMRRWRAPDDDDVNVLDAARESASEKGSLLPTRAQWSQISEMGESLASSKLIKSKFGQLATPGGIAEREADVKLILLAGRDLGIPPTMAIQQIHVIDGKPSISSQLMVALVRHAGYSILPQMMTSTKAIAVGKRLDETVTFEFTLDEAVQAGLVKLNDNGTLGGKDNWVHYTKAMLWARAVSGLCRILFPDVLAGLTYTPEELDSDWNVDAPPVRVENTAGTEPPTDDRPLDDLERAAVLAKITLRTDEQRDRLKAQWAAEKIIHPWQHLKLSDLPLLDELLARYPVAEPETVGEVVQTYPDRPTESVESPLLTDTGRAGPDPDLEAALDESLAPVGQGGDAGDHGEPDDAVVICGECGKPTSEDSPGCGEHPF